MRDRPVGGILRYGFRSLPRSVVFPLWSLYPRVPSASVSPARAVRCGCDTATLPDYGLWCAGNYPGDTTAVNVVAGGESRRSPTRRRSCYPGCLLRHALPNLYALLCSRAFWSIDRECAFRYSHVSRNSYNFVAEHHENLGSDALRPVRHLRRVGLCLRFSSWRAAIESRGAHKLRRDESRSEIFRRADSNFGLPRGLLFCGWCGRGTARQNHDFGRHLWFAGGHWLLFAAELSHDRRGGSALGRLETFLVRTRRGFFSKLS